MTRVPLPVSRVYTMNLSSYFFFFFFNDTATTEIYTLSLHDALPICGEALREAHHRGQGGRGDGALLLGGERGGGQDRESTRLKSSHTLISYSVFCFEKKKNHTPALIDGSHHCGTVTVCRSRDDRCVS